MYLAGLDPVKWKTHNIALINFIGQVFMNGNNSPFDIFDQYIEEIKKNVEIIIIDFHGEATGEKLALLIMLMVVVLFLEHILMYRPQIIGSYPKGLLILQIWECVEPVIPF